MEEEDGLPSLICHTCLCKVEHTFDFRYQCGVADSILRNYIKSQTFQVSYWENLFNLFIFSGNM